MEVLRVVVKYLILCAPDMRSTFVSKIRLFFNNENVRSNSRESLLKTAYMPCNLVISDQGGRVLHEKALSSRFVVQYTMARSETNVIPSTISLISSIER